MLLLRARLYETNATRTTRNGFKTKKRRLKTRWQTRNYIVLYLVSFSRSEPEHGDGLLLTCAGGGAWAVADRSFLGHWRGYCCPRRERKGPQSGIFHIERNMDIDELWRHKMNWYKKITLHWSRRKRVEFWIKK